MRDERRRLEFKCDLGEIDRLAQEVEAFAEAAELPTPLVFDLNLVLEELVTNSISYGYDSGGGEAGVVVDLATEGDLLEARVEDAGRPFDPLSLPAPDVDADIDERRVGGLGVLLVRKLMDEVTYARDGGRNVVAMRKRIAAA